MLFVINEEVGCALWPILFPTIPLTKLDETNPIAEAGDGLLL